MKLVLLLIVCQTAVLNSFGYSSHGDNGCTGFTYGDSSLEDDSDYQLDASGGDNIGDDLRLRVHVNNDWELRVSWNASKYESVVPVLGWNYKVWVTVNTTYQTSFGKRSFTTSTEFETKKNHKTFPLYNPSATYTITVLAATRTQQCLGERIIVSDLSGREDAIRHFQIRLRFYTFWPCERKLQKKHKVLSQFNLGIFDALRKHQNRFGISLDLSHYNLTDLNVMCLKGNSKDSRVAIFTGRIVATGNSSNTGFINAMQSWVRTQPTLPIRKASVVVDKNCPVYYVPASGEYCREPPEVDNKVNVTKEQTDNSSSNSSGLNRGVVIAVIVIAIVLLVIMLALSIVVCCSSRHKIFVRVTNFSFRSRTSVSRRLRVNNVLADIESVNGCCNRSPDSAASNELHQTFSHKNSKGT